jgi:4-methylaminobutanoate oxidase (formaldehyde-forming)
VAWSATLGACVGLAYLWHEDRQPVTVEHVSTGRYEVDVGGRICAVTVGLRPPYDPTNARIRP